MVDFVLITVKIAEPATTIIKGFTCLLDSADKSKNAIMHLGDAITGGHPAGASVDDQTWHSDSLDLLNATSPSADDHVFVPESTAAGRALVPVASPTELRSMPWYGVFETAAGELFVVRVFGEELDGPYAEEGLYLTDSDPAGIDPDDITNALRPKRSVVYFAQSEVSAASAGHDHGGGGGVVREDW